MRKDIPVTATDTAWLVAEVARLQEALEAMSGDLLRVLHERDQVTQQRDILRADLLLAETVRTELFQQHGNEMLRADLWKDRSEDLRAALVAVGPLLPDCRCGCPAVCQRCRVLQQRREALGEDVPSQDGAPTAAG